jgi:long-chain acyl-CoA synthetase
MTGIEDALTFGALLDLLGTELAEKVALKDASGAERSYGFFNARCNQLCDALAARGLSHGARVAILSGSRIDYAEVFGLARMGVIIVPLNTRLGSEEIARLLQDCRPAVIFHDAAHLPVVLQGLAGLAAPPLLVGFDGATAGSAVTGYADLLGEGRPVAPTGAAEAEDILSIIYTSGTTGAPKGAMLTHAAALSNMRVSRAQVLNLNATDRVLAAMPFFHIGGLWYHFFSAFTSGRPCTILPEFKPAQILDCIERDRISVIHLVPTMVSALLNCPEFGQHDISSLRLVFYAGSPMPATLLRQAMRDLPGCGFLQGYGSTEGGIISVLDCADHAQGLIEGSTRLVSCGRPVAQVEMRVTDDNGPLQQGLIGEVEVSSPHVSLGYWQNPEATAALKPGGWLRTGDLGFVDAEGYFHLVDRRNDMIVSGGENIYPSEVEDHLLRVAGVLEAAVFGTPDPRWIEKVTAAVVLRPGATLSERQIIEAVRLDLAHYKCPKDVRIVASLPKNGVGKVVRRKLREALS